jgi:hypothetical protein
MVPHESVITALTAPRSGSRSGSCSRLPSRHAVGQYRVAVSFPV